MNIKEKISDAFTYVISILLIGLWILGAFHGSEKHNVNPFSSNFCVCWYYGLETIWHKTNYNELNDNVKVAAYLVMQQHNNFDAAEQLKFNETKKDLVKIIETLDKKEIIYMKTGTICFADYLASYINDMINASIIYKNSKNLELIYSENTKSLSEKCKTYGLETEITTINNETEKILIRRKESIELNKENFDDNSIDINKMKEDSKKKIELYNQTIKEIFGE